MNNYSEKFRTYIREGEKAAMALPNRGPIQFESNGNVASEILGGYAKYGFYVLENFLDKKDLHMYGQDGPKYILHRPKRNPISSKSKDSDTHLEKQLRK